MKKTPNKSTLVVAILLLCAIISMATMISTQKLYAQEKGKLIVTVTEGNHWIHSFRIMAVVKVNNPPQMAFWLEDSSGNFVSTIFVTHRTAMQDWRPSPGEKKGEIKRPSSLPVWVHQHQVGGVMTEASCSDCHDYFDKKDKKPAPGSPVDAITGATPKSGFTREWSVPPDLQPGTYVLKAEINHSKDFNDYYSEKAAEADFAYSGSKMGSGQPSLVWSGKLQIGHGVSTAELKQIGHGHPAGKTGEIYLDLKNLNTVLDIIESIKVKYQMVK